MTGICFVRLRGYRSEILKHSFDIIIKLLAIIWERILQSEEWTPAFRCRHFCIVASRDFQFKRHGEDQYFKFKNFANKHYFRLIFGLLIPQCLLVCLVIFQSNREPRRKRQSTPFKVEGSIEQIEVLRILCKLCILFVMIVLNKMHISSTHNRIRILSIFNSGVI